MREDRHNDPLLLNHNPCQHRLLFLPSRKSSPLVRQALCILLASMDGHHHLLQNQANSPVEQMVLRYPLCLLAWPGRQVNIAQQLLDLLRYSNFTRIACHDTTPRRLFLPQGRLNSKHNRHSRFTLLGIHIKVKVNHHIRLAHHSLSMAKYNKDNIPARHHQSNTNNNGSHRRHMPSRRPNRNTNLLLPQI